jgi:predicted exporter
LPDEVSEAAPAFGDGNELFASADGTFRIVFVQAAEELSDYRRAVEWLESIQQVIQTTRQQQGIAADVAIHYTGGPAFVAEISTGMRNDIQKSVGAALTIIVLLFWWAHRRLRPLLWMLTLLMLILTATLAMGGLIFGTVNVVSVGFAAILLGLSVDYALVLYQEARHSPGASPRDVKRAVARGIIWSAATTAGAFAILNLGGLPGLAQLGSLVAIGIGLAAFVMIRYFLRPLTGSIAPGIGAEAATGSGSSRGRIVLGWTLTFVLAGVAFVVLLRQPPALDHTTQSLRPKNSPAYAAMELIRVNIGKDREPDWLIVSGRDDRELADRLAALRPILDGALAGGSIESFTLPESLAPRPAFQKANRAAAGALAAQSSALRAAAEDSGFTADSMRLTTRMLETWGNASAVTGIFQPTNAFSHWVISHTLARDTNRVYGLGLVYRAPGSLHSPEARAWMSALPAEGVWLAGWDRLGSDLLDVVKQRFWRVLLPMTALLLTCLWLAFRRWPEVLLSLT